MSEGPILINTKESSDFIASIQDDVVRNLLMVAMGQVGIRLARGPDTTTEQLAERLPCAPFDLLFFAQVLHRMLSQKQLIRDVLDGKTPAEASGWDDGGD